MSKPTKHTLDSYAATHLNKRRDNLSFVKRLLRMAKHSGDKRTITQIIKGVS